MHQRVFNSNQCSSKHHHLPLMQLMVQDGKNQEHDCRCSLSSATLSERDCSSSSDDIVDSLSTLHFNSDVLTRNDSGWPVSGPALYLIPKLFVCPNISRLHSHLVIDYFGYLSSSPILIKFPIFFREIRIEVLSNELFSNFFFSFFFTFQSHIAFLRHCIHLQIACT